MSDNSIISNMAVHNIESIRPTVESLCCNVKGRPKSSLKGDIKKVYHCPIETCKYYETSSFNRIKFLKQHYVKVHQTKMYSCSKCKKSFALKTSLQSHESVCGIQYRCYCNTQFATYEAFLTHAKRKNHGNGFLGYKEMMACLKMHKAAQKFQKNSDNSLKVRAIIVEDSPQKELLILNKKQANTATSKETQTGMKMCKILPKVSSQTQTAEENTVSIQTSITHMPKRRRRSKLNGINTASSSRDNISFSTSSTQTTPIKEEKLSKLLPVNQPSQTPSQEYPPVTFEDTLDSSSSPTRFIDSFTDPNFGSSFSNWSDVKSDALSDDIDVDLIFYSNSETQTAFEDLFDNSCMDTYTQTCDSLFSDLDFVDIQTQTSWSIFDDSMKTEQRKSFDIL